MNDNGDGTYTDLTTGVIYDSQMNQVGTDTTIAGGGGGGAPLPAGGGDGSGNTSLANFGTIFSTIGTAFASAYHAVTGPSTNVINPRTGAPYTQAQLTALAQQNAALGPLSGVNIVPIAVIVLVAVILLRK